MSKISVFLVLTLLSLVISTPASAYYLVKMDKNNLVVYQGAVLGDDDSAESEEKAEDITAEKTPEIKTEEPKKLEQGKSIEVRKDSPTAGNRQNEVRRGINEVRKNEKREDQLEKKNQLNKSKKQVFIDPKTSTLSINQLTPENGKKIEELKNRREKLELEMEKKGKKLTANERKQFEQKIKESRDAEEKLGSKNIQEIKDPNLEIESDKMKIRLEDRSEDRQKEILKKRLEERRKNDKDGTEMEKKVEVENETEEEDSVKEVEIEDGVSRVRTDLPVGIDASSGGMFIKTEDGGLTTENTPSKVLERLRSKKVIDGFSSDDQGETTSEIVVEGDKPVYNIKGTRKARLFGFVPVNFEKEVKVDAETGDVIETNQSGFSRFFERFSL